MPGWEGEARGLLKVPSRIRLLKLRKTLYKSGQFIAGLNRDSNCRFIVSNIIAWSKGAVQKFLDYIVRFDLCGYGDIFILHF